jgi:transketolase
MQEELYRHLEAKARWVRMKVLDMAVHAKSGHISSAFSQTELLVALYHGGILRHDPQNPRWEERDRFILSKGQGGIGLYPILADVGYFPLSELDNFAGRGNMLGVHAEWHTPGVEILSGSLGHGLPIATGIAQVGLERKKDWLVFCLLGDAELYEGSNWEAALFAAHKGLSNLVCIVDRNGQGVMGFTDDVEAPNDGPRLNPLDEKFAAFGFEVRVIDGHSYSQIFETFKDVRHRQGWQPLVVIANTRKGKGASIMENKRLWHYRVPTGQDLEITRGDLLR